MDRMTERELKKLIAAYEDASATRTACGSGKSSPPGALAYQVAFEMARQGYRHCEATLDMVRRYVDFGGRAGLWIQGTNGTGKTYFFDRIEDALARRRVRRRELYLLPLSQVVRWTMDELWKWLDMTSGCDVLLDDVGVEVVASDYGRKFEPLSVIVDHRATRCTGRTHLTTNLDLAALTVRYRAGTVDRMRSLAIRKTLSFPSMRRDGAPTATTLPVWPVAGASMMGGEGVRATTYAEAWRDD